MTRPGHSRDGSTTAEADSPPKGPGSPAPARRAGTSGSRHSLLSREFPPRVYAPCRRGGRCRAAPAHRRRRGARHRVRPRPGRFRDGRRRGPDRADGTVALPGTYPLRELQRPGVRRLVLEPGRLHDPSRHRRDRAVCDAAAHRRVNTGRAPLGAFVAGAAHVEATVRELRTFSGLPLPTFRAVRGQDLTPTRT
ncbi:DUF6299 family protein [Streptomyces sp. NPDC092370]|uniref:DUF6299 family protein n=1 Tax=Streptomyces sp. NPDC092370 TaxID=3366016 RepID=UPI0037FB7208